MNSGPHDASVDLTNMPAGAIPPPPPLPPPPLPSVNVATPAGKTDRKAHLNEIAQGVKLRHVEQPEEKTASKQPTKVEGLEKALLEISSTLPKSKKKFKPPTEKANAAEWSDESLSEASDTESESEEESAVASAQPTDHMDLLKLALQKRRKGINGNKKEVKKEKLKIKPPIPPRPPKEKEKAAILDVPTEKKTADISPLKVVIPPQHLSPENESFPSPPSPWVPEMRGTRRYSSSDELPPPPPPLSPLPQKEEDMPSPGKKFKEDSPGIADTLRAGITCTQEERVHVVTKSLNDLLTAFSTHQAAEVRAIQSKLLEIVNPTAKENDQKMSMSKSLTDLPQLELVKSEPVKLTEDRSTWEGALLMLYKSKGNKKPSPGEVSLFAVQANLIGNANKEFRAFAISGMKY